MIGSMSGPMSGAIGEGMSDVLAIVINGDDRVGEYSASDPLGIRSAPYANYPRTYGDVTGTERALRRRGLRRDRLEAPRALSRGGLTTDPPARSRAGHELHPGRARSSSTMRDGILAAATTRSTARSGRPSRSTASASAPRARPPDRPSRSRNRSYPGSATDDLSPARSHRNGARKGPVLFSDQELGVA